MKKKLLVMVSIVAMFAMILTGCGSSSSTDASDTSLEDLQKAGVMKVGMCPEYPPFESLNEDGEIEGFDVDLANAIAEKLGVKTEFVNTPYEGLISGLQNGDFDIIMSGMSPEETDSAEETLCVTDNYYAVPEVILTKDSSIKSKEDLVGKKVGSHAGSTSEYAVQSLLDEGIELESASYNRHSEAFADLKNGNIDAQIVEETWAKEKVQDGDGITILEDPVTTVNAAGVIGHGKEAFTEAYNKALQELKDDGTYDEIVEKWFG